MSNKAIFLDRDDTLIEDPGYINSPDQVKLLPIAAASLIELKQMGYKLIVVTNQSGVARGIVKEEAITDIHHQLKTLLGREGAYLDAIYYCPYHPNGVIPKFSKESDLRKPNPGMILKAADEHDIDLSQSWMVGNSYRDITAGLRAGCRTILINSSAKPAYKKIGDPEPDKKAVNIREVANIIKMHHLRERISATAEPKEPLPVVETTTAEPAGSVTDSISAMDAAAVFERPENIDEHISPKVKLAHPEKTHRLLEEVLRHVRIGRREEMFHEFSLAKLFAGISQGLVVFCLLLSLWFLMDSSRPVTAVHTAIGYAIVLQLMTIGLYMLRDGK